MKRILGVRKITESLFQLEAGVVALFIWMRSLEWRLFTLGAYTISFSLRLWPLLGLRYWPNLEYVVFKRWYFGPVSITWTYYQLRKGSKG